MAEKISQLPAAAALTGAELVPMVQDGATVQAPIGAFHVPDYISGLKMVWNSANSLSVTSGAAYISSLGRVVRLGAAASLTGLTLTTSTWYHVYLYLNAGTPAIECVATSPAASYYGTARAKTGDTSRRYIGSVLTDASGNIYRFAVSGNKVFNTTTDSAGPFAVLANGQSTSLATFSLAAVAPTTAASVLLHTQNTDPSIYLFLKMPDGTVLSAVKENSIAAIEVPLDATRTLGYSYSVTPSGGFLREHVCLHLRALTVHAIISTSCVNSPAIEGSTNAPSIGQ